MKIYLDSNKTPKDNDWTIIRSYHDFIHLVSTSFDMIKEISFCYNLDENGNGFDCVNFLLEYCKINNKNIPQIYSHSSDWKGRETIITFINNYLTFNEKEENAKWIYIDYI